MARETLTSRERVLRALDHTTPDRVPIDLGGFQTGIHRKAYEALLRHLGITEEITILDPVQQLARPVRAGPAALPRGHALPRRPWSGQLRRRDQEKHARGETVARPSRRVWRGLVHAGGPDAVHGHFASSPGGSDRPGHRPGTLFPRATIPPGSRVSASRPSPCGAPRMRQSARQSAAWFMKPAGT